jgi:hypothetical protein
MCTKYSGFELKAVEFLYESHKKNKIVAYLLSKNYPIGRPIFETID